MASRPSHDPQHKVAGGLSFPVYVSWAYILALQLGTLNHVGGRPHLLSIRHLPFASVTHFYMDYLLFIDPESL